MSSPSVRPIHLTVTDVEILARKLSDELKGLSFDRGVVPDRPEFPHGFLKGEWSLRFRSRQEERSLLISVRSQNAFCAVFRGKGPRASEQGTRSGFDLALNKTLDGLKISAVEQHPGDRIITIWFSTLETERAYGLVLVLIPALPEALLIAPGEQDFRILGRTRAGAEKETRFQYPPPAGTSREWKRTLPDTIDEWPRLVHEHRQLEALVARRTRLSREVRALLKATTKRVGQTEASRAAAEKEPDYAHWADLLKSVLGRDPGLDGENRRNVSDWETDQEVRVPCDPKLNLTQQVRKFYDLAKRRERRLAEADGRARELRARIQRLEELDRKIPEADLGELGTLENELGLGAGPRTDDAKKAYAGFGGKVFFSQEGLPILVGRSREENLELTFKFARGNDLWFHVRGKPGAHVVVPLRSKKHASLDTLLDAATLAVYYSGGESWGKTEVDYTQKKHVKRIRESTEASYTQNKTLIVTAEPSRLERLKAD